MMGLPAGIRIWLAAGVTDMRSGMNGLVAKVQLTLLEDPLAGHAFVFRGRRGNVVKVLWATSDGGLLLIKQLERGGFVWPQTSSGKVHLTQVQLPMLLEGVNWKQPERIWPPLSLLYTFQNMRKLRACLSFPDDIETLKALLLERDGELQYRCQKVLTLELALSVRTLEIEQLILQITQLKRMVFGRKSEKIDKKLEQLETRLEDLIAEEGAAEQTAKLPVRPR